MVTPVKRCFVVGGLLLGLGAAAALAQSPVGAPEDRRAIESSCREYVAFDESPAAETCRQALRSGDLSVTTYEPGEGAR